MASPTGGTKYNKTIIVTGEPRSGDRGQIQVRADDAMTFIDGQVPVCIWRE